MSETTCGGRVPPDSRGLCLQESLYFQYSLSRLLSVSPSFHIRVLEDLY